jgi:L-aspartate oxidase
LQGWRARSLPEVPGWPNSCKIPTNRHGEMVLIAHNWDIIRRLMWNYVGIVRTDSRLSLARTHIAQIRLEIREHMPHIQMNNDLLELQNLALVAQLIIHCAIQRKESRGLHYNMDHPHKDNLRCRIDTVIQREVEDASCD